MNLGTIAFNKKVFNLDHMTSEELDEVIKNMENDILKKQKEIKKMLKWEGSILVDKIKKNNEKNFIELIDNTKKTIKDEIKVLSAMQYNKSREIILRKISNENAAITYGISLINKKVIENLEKYSEVESELTELMKKYEKRLIELAKYHDSQIMAEYIKLYEEELRQLEFQTKVYYLIQEEKKAKEKVDNSDDEIREKICDLEDELAKIDIKIKRIKPIIKKKILDKEEELNKAIESKENGIQKETIKGPRIFSKATRFFLGKIKPLKAIEKNVFTNLKNRLEIYENEERQFKKINEQYLEENIIDTIEKVIIEDNGGLE